MRVFKTLTCIFACAQLFWMNPSIPIANAQENKPSCILKVGMEWPSGMGWPNQMREILIPEVETASNGDIDMKAYWPEVMGNAEEYLGKLRVHQLQMVGFSGAGSAVACPEFSILELPFLFDNYQEVDYVRERMMDTFDSYFVKKKLKLTWWMDQDFDQLYSSKNALASLSDFKGARFINWCGPIEKATLHALDANIVPSDIAGSYFAWQGQTIDSGILPASRMTIGNNYMLAHFVNPIKIRYSPVAIVIGLDFWNEMSKPCRESILNSRVDITKKFTEATRSDNKRCLDALVAYGFKETQMTTEGIDQIKMRSLTVYDELAGVIYPVELLRELTHHLRQFRGN